MIPQIDKSWFDYRALNQNWTYRPTLASYAIYLSVWTFLTDGPWSQLILYYLFSSLGRLSR